MVNIENTLISRNINPLEERYQGKRSLKIGIFSYMTFQLTSISEIE